MANNNFGAVGWGGDDEAAVIRAVRMSTEHGAEVTTGEGTTYWLWSDRSGAGIATFGRGDPLNIYCAKPYFWRADAPRFTGVFASVDTSVETCWYCSAVTVEPVDCGGMPLIFEVIRPVEVHAGYDQVPAGTVELEVSVTAFARSLDVWADEAAFRAADDDGAPGFAARSFIPSGAFGDRPTAHALFHGEVSSSSWETNGDTGVRFARFTVATLGLSLDVVAAAPLVGGELPEERSIVRVEGWLVGTIHAAAPVARAGDVPLG